MGPVNLCTTEVRLSTSVPAVGPNFIAVRELMCCGYENVMYALRPENTQMLEPAAKLGSALEEARDAAEEAG